MSGEYGGETLAIRTTALDVLGEPLTIGGVAKLIGCSAWSVRQTLVPMGLPHFRSGPNGKLIFYRSQVVRWIQSRQEHSVTKRRRH